MSLEGMDVDQAQSLAGQLGGYAQALAHVTAALTALAAELSHSWRGPASATFQQYWTAQYRPALDQAAQALADMHTHLVANIAQQVHTSDTNPGPSLFTRLAEDVTLAGVAAAVSRGWNDLQNGAGWETLLDKTHEIAGFKDVTGRYDKKWTQLIELDHDSPLLKYKQSPILHALHDDPAVQGVNDLLVKTHGDEVLEKLGPAGTVLGGISVLADFGQAGAAFSQHHYTSMGGDLVNATADSLKNSKNPVLFLAGGTLALYKEDYDLGSQVDWHDIPSPLSVENLRTDYLPTLGSLPGQMVGPLQKAFL